MLGWESREEIRKGAFSETIEQGAREVTNLGFILSSTLAPGSDDINMQYLSLQVNSA